MWPKGRRACPEFRSAAWSSRPRLLHLRGAQRLQRGHVVSPPRSEARNARLRRRVLPSDRVGAPIPTLGVIDSGARFDLSQSPHSESASRRPPAEAAAGVQHFVARPHERDHVVCVRHFVARSGSQGRGTCTCAKRSASVHSCGRSALHPRGCRVLLDSALLVSGTGTWLRIGRRFRRGRQRRASRLRL